MKQKEIEVIIDNILFIKSIVFKSLVNATGVKDKISPGIYYVMLVLDKFGALSMSRISKEIAIPKPNVTILVDKLISGGLAERIPGKKDRRIIEIKLTKKGLNTKKEVDKTLKEHTFQKLFSLSPPDIKLLSELLSKVRNIFEKIPK